MKMCEHCGGIVFDKRRDPRAVVLQIVANHYGTPVRDIIRQRKTRRLIAPRFVISWLLTEMGYSRAEIGEIINKDRTTVDYEVGRVWHKRVTDYEYMMTTNVLLAKCHAALS